MQMLRLLQALCDENGDRREVQGLWGDVRGLQEARGLAPIRQFEYNGTFWTANMGY